MNTIKNRQKYYLLIVNMLFLLLLIPVLSFGQVQQIEQIDSISINNQTFIKTIKEGQAYLVDEKGVSYPLATEIQALNKETLALDLSEQQLEIIIYNLYHQKLGNFNNSQI